MRRRALALTAGALLLAACGGDDGGRFDAEVSKARAAVEAGDREAALAAFDEIAVEALGAGQSGEIEEAELQEIAALVQQGRMLVGEELPGATTTAEAPTTTTTDAPVVVQASPDDGGDDRDDKDDDERDERDGDRDEGKGRRGKGDD
jgi:hypothetical protein